MPRLTLDRHNDHFSIWRRLQRHHENLGTVYVDVRSHVWVWLVIAPSDATKTDGMYSFFMSIGSVIRTDAPEVYAQAYLRAQRRRPLIIAQQAFHRRDKTTA
jgi:hypothetical protein